MRKILILATALFLLLLSGGTVRAADDIPPILSPLDSTGIKHAVRLDPPKPVWPTGIWNQPFAPLGLSDCQEMMFYANQFGLPAQFEGIGYRESNCRNEDGVKTGCCHGYWQLHEMHFAPGNRIDQICGADSYLDINSDDALEKQMQACAAKQLYDAAGSSPWAATR